MFKSASMVIQYNMMVVTNQVFALLICVTTVIHCNTLDTGGRYNTGTYDRLYVRHAHSASYGVSVTVSNTDQIIERLISRREKPNKLIDIVNRLNLRNIDRIFEPYNPLTSSIFPNISANDVNLYACGSYAVKFLRAYKAHTLKLRRAGQSILDPFKFVRCSDLSALSLHEHGFDVDELELFRCEIRGRLSTGRTHKVFILVDKQAEGIEAFIEHHCDCKSGQRTNCCCLHVAASIWLLGGGMRDVHPGPAMHLDQFAPRIGNNAD